MRRILALVVLAGGLLVGCSDSPSPGPNTPPTAASTPVPDWTVVSRARYSGGADGKTGTYVTIMMGGKEREVAIHTACFSVAELAKLLPEMAREPLSGAWVNCR